MLALLPPKAKASIGSDPSNPLSLVLSRETVNLAALLAHSVEHAHLQLRRLVLQRSLSIGIGLLIRTAVATAFNISLSLGGYPKEH